MPALDAVIFDLDGTLWDTTETCVRVWNELADAHGIDHPHVTVDDMHALTGKPHAQCIEEFYAALPEEQRALMNRETAVGDIEAIEREGGRIFPGVGEGLRELRERVPLMIVSNCQAGYIENFLDFSGFGSLIDDHECWGNTKRSKSENVSSVIARNGLRAPIFVGDTEGDELAARDNAVSFAFVSYGFGTTVRADLRADDFPSLVRQLLDRCG